MSTPLVFKFGGASVKDAASVRNVARIIALFAQRPMVVVVSAMGKMTNAFEEVVAAHSRGAQDDARKTLSEIREFHAGIIDELFGDSGVPEELTRDLDQWFEGLENLLNEAPSGSYGERYDRIVHHGELISTRIVAAFLSLQTEVVWQDTRNLVSTDSQFRRATVRWSETERRIRAAIADSRVHLVQGFIGSDDQGRPTTLGREGSDYTGAVFAYCLGANSLTIWKDVPGMLNGDPKTFKNTTRIEELPFDEAIELAFYGASIIHPKTIQPLKKRGIPLHIKSFVDPEAPGTTIGNALRPRPEVANFILKPSQALLELRTKDLAFIAEHHLSAVYALFAEQGVVVNLMQNSATKAAFCINNDPIIVPKVVEALQRTFMLRLQTEVELLTIRHYSAEAIAAETRGMTILLEQRTPETVQFVFER